MALPPGGCDWSATGNNAGSAVCTSSPIIDFCVNAECVHVSVDYTDYGPRVRLDLVSVAECNGSDLLETAPGRGRRLVAAGTSAPRGRPAATGKPRRPAGTKKSDFEHDRWMQMTDAVISASGKMAETRT